MDMQSSIVPLYHVMLPVETAAGDVFTYTFPHPAIIRDFQLLVVNAVVDTDTTDAVVAVDLDPSDSARVELSRVTITNGSAKGASFGFNEVDAFDVVQVKAGDQIIVEQITQGVDDAAVTGEYIVYMFVQWKPDGRV